MTQEEKAKAYDDLLVKLQKAKVDNDVCDERYCCVINSIVPELRESKDEKIKKLLMGGLELHGNEIFAQGELDMILAWLEKQGEKGAKGNEREIPNSEQKPADKDKPNLLTVERAIKVSPFMKAGFENEPAAWSEEDEYLLGETIQRLEELMRIAKYCGIDVQPYQRDIDWAKSLKDRVGCEVNYTTTNEWNDEQIKVCKEVYADLLSAKGFDVGTINSELNRLEEQLKKLKE